MDVDRSWRGSALEERLLRRCLQLASRGRGRTSPNPMVGAVVARGRRVLAEAFHRRAGGAHAEAAALRRAGRGARGATLYVNLEPCSHWGRTPPCVEAILSAGVRRVVACHTDPDPRVRGRGFRALARAGVRVRVGPLGGEARRLNETYLVRARLGRPFVLVKAAVTLDGRIATASGESRWITSADSRRAAHRLRADSDAILVGVETVLADDPRLTVRGPARGKPARVVLDSRLRTPPGARLLSASGGGPVLIYCTRTAPRSRARRLASRGAEVVVVGRPADRLVDLAAVLRDLARRQVSSVLIEGGGRVIGTALRRRLADRVVLFAAPLILGCSDAVPLAAGRGARRLADAVKLRGLRATRVGPDLMITASPAAPGS